MLETECLWYCLEVCLTDNYPHLMRINIVITRDASLLLLTVAGYHLQVFVRFLLLTRPTPAPSGSLPGGKYSKDGPWEKILPGVSSSCSLCSWLPPSSSSLLTSPSFTDQTEPWPKTSNGPPSPNCSNTTARYKNISTFWDFIDLQITNISTEIKKIIFGRSEIVIWVRIYTPWRCPAEGDNP